MPCGFSYGLAIGFTQNYVKRSKVVFTLSWKLEHANVPVSLKYWSASLQNGKVHSKGNGCSWYSNRSVSSF